MDRFVILRGEMARPRQFVASPLPAYARRVKELRKSLSLNQLEFGKQLKCSSMVISRWERGLQKPPADCLVAMGKMAGPPAGWFFWKMAGITPSDAKRMLQKAQP
jgi:DNA-binding XRE family transcriptional regulator